MNGVDTNIIVRLLTGDDPGQSEKARAVLKRPDTFIAETVMLETEWVLRHAYNFEAAAIYDAFMKLCGLPNVVLANPHQLQTALQWYADGIDFGDALHLAASQACGIFYSFDRKLIRKAEGRGQCKVKEPQ
jgi:predicted nucleic-acid-binding protein